ncbi:MAG: hypothetical protein HYV32_04840 [Candidatus Kerfeldbacteria bacterium]|nr:hypothetical protein [Candidatus Kerfeldbacteria bacterium]
MIKNERSPFLKTERLIDTNKEEPEKENPERKEKRMVMEWVKKVISYWHDHVQPDYIFLTETSAVPRGYLMKETWRYAYPNEQQPMFYRYDLHARLPYPHFRNPEAYYRLHSPDKVFIQKRIRENSPTIIVYDEGNWPSEPSYIEIDPITEKSSSLSGDGGTALNAGYHLTRMMKEAGIQPNRILVTRGGPEKFYEGTNKPEGESRPTSRLFGVGLTSSDREKTLDEALITEEYLINLAEKGFFSLTGRAVKHPEQRKNALTWIEEIKKVGAEAGRELKNEIETKK